MRTKHSKKNKDVEHEKIKEFMVSRNLWSEKLSSDIPLTYEKFGDMILFSTKYFQNEEWQNAGEELWKLICDVYQVKKIGLKSTIKNDSFRTPKAKLIYGDSPYTNFTDNKIRYTWNIEKNMFCSGNVTERHRIASYDCTDEIIVDLFAGIGYFVLPYLIHAKAKFVHACEWNPDAVEALKMNLALNNLSDRCKIYFGDNKMVCPKRIANRVNLGLIPSSSCAWETACDALINSGGILYIHENVTSNINEKNCCQDCILIQKSFSGKTSYEIQKENDEYKIRSLDSNLNVKKLEWFYFSFHISHILLSLFHKTRNEDWKISIKDIFKVKSYAPHIDHIVYSVHCLPQIN